VTATWGTFFQTGTPPNSNGAWSPPTGGATTGLWKDGAVGSFDGIYQCIFLAAGATYSLGFSLKGDHNSAADDSLCGTSTTAMPLCAQLGVYANKTDSDTSCAPPAALGLTSLSIPVAPSPASTPTATPTYTPSPSRSPSPTPSATPSRSATQTPSATISPTPSQSLGASATSTSTRVPTVAINVTFSLQFLGVSAGDLGSLVAASPSAFASALADATGVRATPTVWVSGNATIANVTMTTAANGTRVAGVARRAAAAACAGNATTSTATDASTLGVNLSFDSSGIDAALWAEAAALAGVSLGALYGSSPDAQRSALAAALTARVRLRMRLGAAGGGTSTSVTALAVLLSACTGAPVVVGVTPVAVGSSPVIVAPPAPAPAPPISGGEVAGISVAAVAAAWAAVAALIAYRASRRLVFLDVVPVASRSWDVACVAEKTVDPTVPDGAFRVWLDPTSGAGDKAASTVLYALCAAARKGEPSPMVGALMVVHVRARAPPGCSLGFCARVARAALGAARSQTFAVADAAWAKDPGGAGATGGATGGARGIRTKIAGLAVTPHGGRVQPGSRFLRLARVIDGERVVARGVRPMQASRAAASACPGVGACGESTFTIIGCGVRSRPFFDEATVASARRLARRACGRAPAHGKLVAPAEKRIALDGPGGGAGDAPPSDAPPSGSAPGAAAPGAAATGDAAPETPPAPPAAPEAPSAAPSLRGPRAARAAATVCTAAAGRDERAVAAAAAAAEGAAADAAARADAAGPVAMRDGAAAAERPVAEAGAAAERARERDAAAGAPARAAAAPARGAARPRGADIEIL